MMTPRDAILGRLGRSTAPLVELYDALVRYAGTRPDETYQIACDEIRNLREAGGIEYVPQVGVYRLTGKLMPDGGDE